jgi:hypothetical protein
VHTHESAGKESNTMLMRKYAKTSYYKLDHVRGGPKLEVIKEVKDGKYDKPDLIFESGNILSANKTTVSALIDAFGDDSRSWADSAVEVYQGHTSDPNGNLVDCVLARRAPEAAAPLPNAKKADHDPDLDREIPY